MGVGMVEGDEVGWGGGRREKVGREGVETHICRPTHIKYFLSNHNDPSQFLEYICLGCRRDKRGWRRGRLQRAGAPRDRFLAHSRKRESISPATLECLWRG